MEIEDRVEMAWCKRGMAIDVVLFGGNPAGAIPQYQALLDEMVETGEVSAYVGAKAALGLLYGYIGVHDHVTAHAFWIGARPEMAKLWVQCLEAGQLLGRDQCCYFLVEAYLYSLASNPTNAVAGMKQRMISALNWATTHRDDEVVIAAASNWRLHLSEIFEDAHNVPPSELAERRTWIDVNGVTGPLEQPRLILPKLLPWSVV